MKKMNNQKFDVIKNVITTIFDLIVTLINVFKKDNNTKELEK